MDRLQVSSDGASTDELERLRVEHRAVFGRFAEEIPLLARLLELAPEDEFFRKRIVNALWHLKRSDEAAAYMRQFGVEAEIDGERVPQLASDALFFVQDGVVEKADRGFYRGERVNAYPKDRSFQRDDVLAAYFMRGLMPAEPFLDRGSEIVAFGSCFAGHISDYLGQLGFNVATRRPGTAYVSRMGDGMVHTCAIRQQFEWAWRGEVPTVPLWHGYKAEELGYDENVRAETRAMFDAADAFIVTLGLSEVWYDEPTGEVFWRAVPKERFDPSRHKFRCLRQQENRQNIDRIYKLIRRHRPEAAIVFTLSPIPLLATFRDVPAVVADSGSKASLRSALDEFMQDRAADARLFYFPSYEVATRAFDHPYKADRRHVHDHILDVNMAAFERYFCRTGLTDEDIAERFRVARSYDQRVRQEGDAAGLRKTSYRVS